MNDSKNKPLTYYAPAEKSSMPEIESSYHSLKQNSLIRMFQEAMPDLAMILNKNRQLVYANNNLIKFLDIEDGHLPLGMRLGNLLNCIHANDYPSGCGTTEACRFCGIVNAVLESQASGKPIVKEARITAIEDEDTTSYDLKIKASPLLIKDEDYTILCINDISDRKRRAILEASLNGTALELTSVVSSVSKDEKLESDSVSVENAEKMKLERVQDLLAQKMLNDAEENKLITQVSLCNSNQLLRDLELYFSKQQVTAGKKFQIDPFSHSVKFRTDVNIIKRVLINITTNAFEAIDNSMVVRVGSRLNNKELRFWIFSPIALTDEANHQIFQRSFSTKGINRGLGTYFARLLTTKYLKGKIYFKSEINGTTFFIDIPLSID